MKKLILLLFIPLVFTCSSDSSDDSSPCPNQPQLTTNEVSDISVDATTDLASATFSGEILNIQLGDNCETFSITNQGFVYSTTIQPTIEDNVVNANGESITVSVDGLVVETTYYVRTFITNVLGTFYGNEVSFTTPESPNPVYLDENGVTVKAKDWAEVGMTGDINGVTFTIVNNEMISSIADTNGNGGLNICTTFVTDMNNLFYSGMGVITNVTSWDVSNVTNMEGLFAYQQGQDLSYWDVSNVTNMQEIFAYSTGNFQIENWDVSNVTNMSYMFNGAEEFNQNIGDWDVSNVINMSYMFNEAYSFNQDISSWDVSEVTNMSFMFNKAKVFNQYIGDWNVSNVINMGSMFSATHSTILDSSFNQDISNWNVANVTNMSHMFEYAESFNGDISNWDVSNVTGMYGMFQGAVSFNQDLSAWNVDSVISCYHFCIGAISWVLPMPDFINCPEWLGCN